MVVGTAEEKGGDRGGGKEKREREREGIYEEYESKRAV